MVNFGCSVTNQKLFSTKKSEIQDVILIVFTKITINTYFLTYLMPDWLFFLNKGFSTFQINNGSQLNMFIGRNFGGLRQARPNCQRLSVLLLLYSKTRLWFHFQFLACIVLYLLDFSNSELFQPLTESLEIGKFHHVLSSFYLRSILSKFSKPFTYHKPNLTKPYTKIINC